MKIKRKNGFTIVELVIVIAVIAILAAILVPTISKLVKKAHVTSDTQLVRNLNTSLAMDASVSEHTTMQEALNAAAAYGYDVGKINASATDNMILWDSVNDVFCYRMVDEEGNVSISYIPNSVEAGKELDPDSYKLWIVSDTIHPNFSTYYTGTASTINTSKGFDAGTCTTIEAINYTKSTATQDVVIRTNGDKTTLTIDADTDTVTHYGEAGSLNIIAVNSMSYHENGKVGFAEIKEGRFVFEPKSEVEHIHINSNGSNAFNEVIFKDNGTEKLPTAITRDVVSLAADASVNVVTVISVSGTSEIVKAYGSSATGSTQKTEVQNTAVESDLGALVLDNGMSSDKALDNESKQEVKDEVASEAVSAEFASQEGNDNYVARIGQTGYATLAAAIDVANAADSAVTISILKNIQMSGALIIRNSVNIKGANHVITTVGTATSGNMAAFDICDTETKTPITVNIQDMTVNSTKHARVFLLNGDYNSYDDRNIMTATNINVTTDGQAFYSNGPCEMTVRNCEIKHEGQYLSGKDPVYYSALIVGYNGTLNVYDCKVSSFGNGAATFPSGGTVNIYNTDITAFDDFVDASAGYVFWARHEKSYDTGAYTEWCGSAIINVYSGNFAGPYRVTHDGLTALNRVGEINIFGGNFGNDPSEYVEAGHTATHNADGSWTVR